MPDKIDLRLARMLAGYKNREKIASKIGVSTTTIANWENGNSKPDIEQAYMLAKYYDLPIDAIKWY